MSTPGRVLARAPRAAARAEPATPYDARPFLPARVSMASLREAAAGCRGCPLYLRGTQTVFGEGRRNARLVLVGEQPGDAEDLSGHPFVGPAGRLLDDALSSAGIARSDAYVTNVVKHFKWEQRGKRRLHGKPNAREVKACLPWLRKELQLLRPQVLVCLGATAARALLGSGFKVSVQRGKPVTFAGAEHALATVHPSSILRQLTSEDRRRELAHFIKDLRVAGRLLAG
ncbi:MAG TPA: UdgX family uracil-DNA binding protein [Planctomycetota bacterium]|nr:UdgX family uracil-DNA binding protein [Planctomycetota bacterium]